MTRRSRPALAARHLKGIVLGRHVSNRVARQYPERVYRVAFLNRRRRAQTIHAFHTRHYLPWEQAGYSRFGQEARDGIEGDVPNSQLLHSHR